MNTLSCIFLFFSLLCPPLGFILGFYGLKRDWNRWRVYIFCIALCIASFAYSYFPIVETDLFRYDLIFQDFSTRTLADIFSKSDTSKYREMFTFKLMAMFFGRCDDYHLASAVTAFFIYLIGFYVTCYYGEKNKQDTSSIVFYLLLLVFGLYFDGIVNNIRNVFAFALVGLAVFRDVFHKKRNIWTLLLYVLPIFIHNTVLIFIVFRLLLAVNKKMKGIIGVCLGLSAVLSDIAFRFVYPKLSGSGSLLSILKNVIYRGYYFFHETSSAWGEEANASGTLTLLKYIYVFMAIGFVVLTFFKYKKKGSLICVKTNETINTFPFYIAFITIASGSMFMPEYWRFASAMLLFGAPVVLDDCFAIGKQKVDLCGLLIWIFLFCAMVCTALSLRMLLSHCDITKFLSRPFASSPLWIIPRDIVRFFEYRGLLR